MRLVLTVVLLLLSVGLVGFLLKNPDETVTLTLWTRQYTDVPLPFVVVIAVALGAGLVGVVALVEGAGIRLANRRLRREIHRLETEINYLRTQPAAAPRPEPDALETERWQASQRRPATAPGGPLPSGPVYDAEGADLPDDPDEDAYSGGRAV